MESDTVEFGRSQKTGIVSREGGEVCRKTVMLYNLMVRFLKKTPVVVIDTRISGKYSEEICEAMENDLIEKRIKRRKCGPRK